MRNLVHCRIVNLQESIRALKIQPTVDNLFFDIEKVLIGKLIASRRYSRHSFIKTIVEAWNLGNKVCIDRVGDDTFKFLFGSKGERDNVFQNRPWSFKGMQGMGRKSVYQPDKF